MLSKILLSCFFLILSCTTGIESQKKSALNYLSGEHFQAKQGLNPFEVKRVSKNTLIPGKVFFTSLYDNFPYPVKFEQIKLMQDGRVKSTVSTDSKGEFMISTPLENGLYYLELDSSSYYGKLAVRISSYKHQEISFLVQPVLEQ